MQRCFLWGALKSMRQIFTKRTVAAISGLCLAGAMSIGLMSCGSDKSSNPTAPNDDGNRGLQSTCVVAADTVLGYTNYERCLQGIAPLTQNSQLDAAAQGHSDAMVTQKFLDHINPSTGSAPMDRVTAAGYVWSAVGENLAQGQATPKAVVAAWMASETHRAHILNPIYVDMGIGVTDKTWTQLLAAP